MRAGGFSGAGSCCAETVSGRTARVWLRPRHISNCAEKRSRFRLAALQKQRGVLGRPCIKSVCGVSQPILSKKCPRCPRSVTPQKQHALLGRSCRKANAARRVGCVQKVTPAQPHGGSVCKFSCLSGRDLPASCLVRPYVAARSCLQVIGCHRSQPFSRSPTRFSRKLTGIGPCDRFVRTRCPASDGGLVRSEEFSASYSIAGALPIAEEHLLPRMTLSRFISPPLGWNCTLDYPPSTKSSSLGK